MTGQVIWCRSTTMPAPPYPSLAWVGALRTQMVTCHLPAGRRSRPRGPSAMTAMSAGSAARPCLASAWVAQVASVRRTQRRPASRNVAARRSASSAVRSSCPVDEHEWGAGRDRGGQVGQDGGPPVALLASQGVPRGRAHPPMMQLRPPFGWKRGIHEDSDPISGRRYAPIW